MKNVLFILLLFCLQSPATGQGIQFESDSCSWTEILDKAMTEQKIIFVAAYSNTCHNCQKMLSDIYPAAAVGAAFNGKYLNAKIDLDAEESLDFSAQYGIIAYPTYLFLNAGGEELHRAVGYKSEAEMIALATQSSDPNYQYFSLKARFEQGDRAVDMLRRLTFMAENLTDYAVLEAVHSVYLDSQSDWLEKTNMKVLFAGLSTIEQPTFSFLLDNLAAFNQEFGEVKVGDRIDKIVLDCVSMYAYDHEQRDFDLEKARAYGSKFLTPALLEKTMSLFEVNQLRRKKQSAEFLSAAARHFDSYPCYNPILLNNMALDVFEQTDDKVLLKKAIAWMQQAIDIREGYRFYDTAAALYLKVEDIANARLYANKALELAKSLDIDAHETLALLEEMEGR